MIKKSIVVLFLVILLVIFLLASLTIVGNVQATTPVSGIISVDTVWTKTNSPYTLTGALAVDTGVTLTIEPGVIVNLNGNYMQINGTLTAKGSNTEPIKFDNGQIQFTDNSIDWDEETNTGSIIQYAKINDTQANTASSKILITQSSPKINNVNITCLTYDATGISITNSAPTISNCYISTYGRCIKVEHGTVTIYNNTLRTVGYNGIEIYNCANALVSGNSIEGQRTHGAYAGAYAVSSNASIYNNLATGFEVGIGSHSILQGASLDNKIDANITFTNNLVFQNQYGISIIVGGTGANKSYNCIQNNTSFKNDIGLRLYREAYSTIITQYNNFLNNSEYDVRLMGSYNATASNNWWGTTNTTAIEQKIYDYRRDFSLGNVIYNPLLSSPNTKAPTFTNATASNHGSIAPTGITRLDCGDNQTFTITPDIGYRVLDVAVNGTSVGNVTSVSLQNIHGATIVSVTFEADVIPEIPSAATLAIVLIIATTATLLYLKSPNISKRTVERRLI